MEQNILRKILCVSYFLTCFCFNVSAKNQKGSMGQEASLFLTLQNINLGILSKREDKRQYLTTIVMEKQRIQNRTLRIIYENAYDLYKRGDYERAKELSEKILTIDPNFMDAQVLMESASRVRGGRLLTERQLIEEKFLEGKSLYEEGRYEDASRIWQEVLAINPRYSQARQWLEKAKSEMGRSYLKRGDSAYQSGKLEQALDNWYKALSLNRNNPELTARIASVESEFRTEKVNKSAYVVLDHVLEIQPGEPRASKLIKEVKGAIAAGYIKTGRGYYSKRNYDKAVNSWNKAAMWGYNKKHVNTLIARAIKQSKREKELKEEKASKAREEAEKAAALAKKEEEERIKAELQAELRASEEAKGKILAVGELTEENRKAAEEHYLRGLVHFQNGEYEKARNEWMLAKQFNPNHTEADAGLKRIEQMYGTAR
jgi:tetratricopeptide (TPR) repeat protein